MNPRAQIVSVTPLAVERDKRTFQNAASIARFGYGSTVVEGQPSRLDREMLPFELLTVGAGAGSAETDPGAEPPGVTVSGAPVSSRPAESSHPLVEAMPGPISTALKRLGQWLLRLRGRMLAPFRLWRLLRRDNELTRAALPPAELYYLTFYWQFPAVWRMCQRTGAGFVYDANDAYWAWPGYRWYPLPFRALLRILERRCVRRAREVITVSEGVAELIERRYGRRPRVVRNAHDTRVDTDSARDARSDCGLPPDAFLVVVVGNEKPSDAVEEAIEALTRLPDKVHLALLGAGYERHVPRISELGLDSRVHLLDPVAPTEVSATIRSADAGLINIRAREVHMHALPTRLFTTIAAGLPVLYPPLPEVTAVAEEHGLGLPVDAEDPDSVAAAIRQLVDRPEFRSELRARVERAHEVLSWEVEEKRLAAILAGALRAAA